MATYAVGRHRAAAQALDEPSRDEDPIVGASPPIVRPTANSTSPIANGRHSGIRSSAPPATTTPSRLPRKNAE